VGTKHIKKTYNKEFQKIIIKNYYDLQSIKKVSHKNNITTRQVINILNDNLVSHDIKRIINLDEKFFDKHSDDIIGQDVMYWAGFIAADGNIMNKQESRSYFLTVNLSIKDKHHLYKLQQSLKSNAKIKTHISKGGFRAGKQFKDTENCKIVFNSKYLVNSLYKYNIIPAKSKTYNITDLVKNHKYVNHFIRGMLDGDGSISFSNNKYVRVSFYGTQECLENISNIILDQCNISKKAISKNRTIFATQYSGKSAILLLKWLYKDANIFLDRKYEKIKNIIYPFSN